MPSNTVDIRITASDQASAKINSIAGKLNTGLPLAAAAGGAALVGLGVASIKMAADFEGAMSESLAIMGDVSDALRGDMSDAAREVALVTTFSAKQAADSYFFLASAGLDAKASIEALPSVAKFAQAGMFDMALATDLLTDAQSALGLTIKNDAIANMKNMVAVGDVLVGANTLANASVQQFSEALTNKAGPAMRAANIDITEGIAVLAAFADQGIKGSEAGTQFAIVLRDLQTKAIKNKEEFAALGIQVFDTQGNLNNLGDTIGQLEDALAGMSEEQIKATLLQLGFSDKSIASLQALLGTSDAIKEYEKSLRSMGGITEEVAEKQLDNFNAQLSLLKSALQDMMITVGTKVLPVLTDFTVWLRERVIPAVKDTVETIREHWGTIDELFIEPLRTVFSVFKNILAAIGGAIRLATAIWKGDWTKAWDALKGVAFNALEAIVGTVQLQLNRVMDAIAVFVIGVQKALDLIPFSDLGDKLQPAIDQLREGVDLVGLLNRGMADLAEVDLRNLLGITGRGGGIGALTSDGLGTGPGPGLVGGTGTALGEILADGFRDAISVADLPAVAADELIKVLDFLQAVIDNRPLTLLDQLNFVQILADQRAELEVEMQRLQALFAGGTPLFELFDMFNESDFGAQKVRDALVALEPYAAQIVDLTDSLGLISEAFGLQRDQVREIAEEFGLIPRQADLLAEALAEAFGVLSLPQIFEFANAMQEAADAAREQADALEEAESHMRKMSRLASATLGILPGNIGQEDLQNILDLLNPNIPGPFTPTPAQLSAGTPVVIKVTQFVDKQEFHGSAQEMLDALGGSVP